MEHKIAIKLSNFLLSNKIIPEEYYEVYVYGNELLLSSLFSTSIIILIGFLLKRVIQSVIFLLVFILVRRFTGGYHANSYFKCKMVINLTHLCVLTISEFTSVALIHYLALFVIGMSTIISVGPIVHPNKPLTNKQRKRNKLIGSVLFTMLVILGAILNSHLSMLSNTMFYSLLSVIVLMIIAKIQIRSFEKEV